MTPSILLGFLRDLVPHLALSSQLHRPWTSVTTVKKLAYHKGFIGIAIRGCRRNGAPKRGATFPSFRLSWCGCVIESSQWDMLYVLPVLVHRNFHVWSWTLFSSPWAWCRQAWWLWKPAGDDGRGKRGKQPMLCISAWKANTKGAACSSGSLIFDFA